MSKSTYAPVRVYTKRKQGYQRFLLKLDRVFNRFVYLKAIVLLVSLATSSYFLILKKFPAGFGLLLLGIFLLIYLDIGHRKIIDYKKYAVILRDINEHSLWRLDGRWRAFSDTGDEFRDDSHPYTSDLDIFGKGSLFQWFNVTQTYLGRKILCHWLMVPPDSIPVIRERQAAIQELAKSLGWRQWFLAHGIAVKDQMRNPDFLFEWVRDRNPVYLEKFIMLSLRALPVLTIGFIIAYFNTKSVPLHIPLLMLALQYGLLKIGKKKRTKILKAAGAYEKNLQTYADLLRQILKKNYQSPLLQRLKNKLFSPGKKSATVQLKKLAKIVDSISNRNNAFYAIINIVTLWDYQCFIALEKWKKTSGESLHNWLATIAEFEALTSLSIIQYDHQEWAVPEFVTGAPLVAAEVMGHPLLADETRVSNALQIGEQAKVLLITGSNMSGKSTYLRTSGINLVLAYTGAPVCAASFCCTLLDIHTCMRISDNLEKNISTFYAEILRIKSIVEATASGTRPVYFLLDEIFKGTNSEDRHTGAKILIKKLIQNNAIGLVSTHDLELGEMANEQPTVKNYHFQEYYQDDKLMFDYHLRPGIVTTRNALYLMKAAGIMVDESGKE